mmetsp:Transcript_37402/g.116496  ORF Transcript_37402/g.116496 Transcript_37402/m.116496 type:complete len:564 (+) Transcript_37402:56-1747(+)
MVFAHGCAYAAVPLFLLTAAWPALAARDELDYTRREPGMHVMRLHRYDHSGLDAMIEAEAKWERGEAFSSPAPGFVQISGRQMEALQKHHRLHRNAASSVLQHSSASTLKIHSRASRAYIRQHHGSSEQPPAIELDRLESQYVGSIGMGTKIEPPGCSSPENSRSLVFLSYGEANEVVENASALGQDVACHLQDESVVWVVLDTGSTNIWVNSDLCTRGACAKSGRKRYRRSESITYRAPKDPIVLNITFGTGKVSGPVAIDDIHVGPYTVSKQAFGMIQEQEGRVFDEVPFEGILGLAFPKMSANGATPFFDNIIQQKVLQKNEFSFYFSLDNPSANAIFWGGTDPDFYSGELAHFKVVDPFYWSIPLVHFKVGNEILLSSSKADAGAEPMAEGNGTSYLEKKVKDPRPPKAIVDTGTTFFTAESELYGKVLDRIPTRNCNQVNDTSHPPITFRLQSTSGKPVDFVLNNMQYMTQSSDGSVCSPAFMRIDIPYHHGPAMVLGEVFLRHYYSVFNRGDGADDHATVSFAKASHGDGAIRELKRRTKSQPGFFATHKYQSGPIA